MSANLSIEYHKMMADRLDRKGDHRGAERHRVFIDRLRRIVSLQKDRG